MRRVKDPVAFTRRIRVGQIFRSFDPSDSTYAYWMRRQGGYYTLKDWWDCTDYQKDQDYPIYDPWPKGWTYDALDMDQSAMLAALHALSLELFKAKCKELEDSNG